MPLLPRLSTVNLIRRELQHHRQQKFSHSSSRLVSKYQRREKDEALTNKLYKLNMHTMRKKSARISMRLSSAFGLSAHTIDERFNFEEQRFRAIDKFLRLFVRNAYTCMEALKVKFILARKCRENCSPMVSLKMSHILSKSVEPFAEMYWNFRSIVSRVPRVGFGSRNFGASVLRLRVRFGSLSENFLTRQALVTSEYLRQ